MTVTITNTGLWVTLAAPYTAELPSRARALGGRFNPTTRTWVFDGQDTQRVRALAIDIYGTDGSDNDAPGVTVRVDLCRVGKGTRCLERDLVLVGHRIAHRLGRDSNVRLGEGVVVVEGEFSRSGGSVKNPAVGDLSGIVVEVRDLPRMVAERMMVDYPAAVNLVNANGDATGVDQVALAAERERLLARLAQINALLGRTTNDEANDAATDAGTP